MGKYSDLRLPMGIACSPDIFQAKMSDLMGTLEFIQTYIDDLLCITKGSLDDHLSKLRRIVIRLRDAQLKVNACKSNRIPRICVILRWYQTTEKEGTSDSCINAP
jgi:hypothetical protein